MRQSHLTAQAFNYGAVNLREVARPCEESCRRSLRIDLRQQIVRPTVTEIRYACQRVSLTYEQHRGVPKSCVSWNTVCCNARELTQRHALLQFFRVENLVESRLNLRGSFYKRDM